MTLTLQLDLPTGEGMQQCFDHLGPVDVVINCAAISSPAACEKEVENARSDVILCMSHVMLQAAFLPYFWIMLSLLSPDLHTMLTLAGDYSLAFTGVINPDTPAPTLTRDMCTPTTL